MNETQIPRPEIYKDEGYKLMSAAFEVYNDRGYGLAEEIYQECLEVELELRGMPYVAKANTVHYLRPAKRSGISVH
jgi:GxxExxY protein